MAIRPVKIATIADDVGAPATTTVQPSEINPSTVPAVPTEHDTLIRKTTVGATKVVELKIYDPVLGWIGLDLTF